MYKDCHFIALSSYYITVTTAYLVPGPVSEDLEDQLFVRASLLHRLYGGLVWTLR